MAMGIGKNIRYHRDIRLGWTLEQLSGASGVDVGTISAIELRDSSRSKYFPDIARGLGLSLDELSMAPSEWEKSHMSGEVSNVRRRRNIAGEVPKISWVQAGDFGDAHDFLEPGDAKDWLPCPVKHGPRTFALQVDGPSMDSGDREGYPDGYDIFVDPDVEARHGDDVVVRTPNGKATFKRLQISNDGNFLLALNPQWPNRIIPVPEGTIICGVVIYSGRSRR